jgi:5-oxoprolinase (ATP-hydrolysing)
LEGPALVLERRSATVVEPGWSVTVAPSGALLLEREAADSGKPVAQPEAVRLELFTQRFRTLVREMGERLEQTAVSTNVKERLDFSCALLDPRGRLVANAPHIPVHLGALGLCVRRVAETLELTAGDVVVTNHPGYGGSHLPDVTVVTPVFEGDRLLGYTASRAHHAEIGGSRPGSMPPAATRLADEGVVLEPCYLLRGGEPAWDEIRSRLEAPPWPSRNVADNLADLRAAVAANHAGAEALRALAASHGAETVREYMAKLGALAARRMEQALRELGDGVYEATESLDDGTPLAVRVEIENGRASLDFAGSGGVHPGNLNVTPAIVHSAVIYVLRLLVREPLPLNEGLLEPVSIRLAPGLLDPEFPDDPTEAPAVVGGNVETSQRIVDTLLKALGIVACSQGTMNNVIFGNPGYGYYETIGGGCGAGPGFVGAGGVHSHMTNTRITDAELLEQRYPVRVERFELRAGSGGDGRFRGGDGLRRELRFLEPAALSLLTQHRREAPYGLDGGKPGARGRQRLVRADGSIVDLGPVDGCEAGAGDLLVVETPGGGGCGDPID